MKRYDSRKTYLLRWKKKYEHLIEGGIITEDEMYKYEKLKKELSLVEKLSALHDSEKLTSSNRGGVRIGSEKKENLIVQRQLGLLLFLKKKLE